MQHCDIEVSGIAVQYTTYATFHMSMMPCVQAHVSQDTYAKEMTFAVFKLAVLALAAPPPDCLSSLLR